MSLHKSVLLVFYSNLLDLFIWDSIYIYSSDIPAPQNPVRVSAERVNRERYEIRLIKIHVSACDVKKFTRNLTHYKLFDIEATVD